MKEDLWLYNKSDGVGNFNEKRTGIAAIDIERKR